MFCPSCGIEYNVELNYCNRCGANLNAAMTETPQFAPISQAKPIGFISACMAAITLVGFCALVGGAVGLSRTHVDSDTIGMMVVIGMLTILTVDIILGRLLSRLVTASVSTTGPHQIRRPSPAALNPQPLAQMQIPRPNTVRLESVPSVTEHTTRFFEPPHQEPLPVPRRQTAENLKH